MIGTPLAHHVDARRRVRDHAADIDGTCIAVEHVRLEWIGVLECPRGVTGILAVPQESLIVFFLLGATAGIYNVIRSAMRLNREAEGGKDG